MKQCLFFGLALLLFALLTACGEPADPLPINQKHEVTQEDIVRAEQLLSDKQIDADERVVAAIANDLQRLENTFWREAVAIEEIHGTDILYSITYNDVGVKDLVRVTEDGSGPINVIVTEGDTTDTWVYRSSGQIVFNRLSMRTHCKETEPEGSPLRTVPAPCFNQTPESAEDLMVTPQYQPSGEKGLLVESIPLPKTDMTLSSRINQVAVQVGESLAKLGCSAPGSEIAQALGAALAENQELAGQVLSKHPDPPSYKVYQYVSEDATVYVVDTYENDLFYGDHFVWGVLEENRK